MFFPNPVIIVRNNGTSFCWSRPRLETSGRHILVIIISRRKEEGEKISRAQKQLQEFGLFFGYLSKTQFHNWTLLEAFTSENSG